MRFKIIHDTNYSFSSEVFIEPHYLRFKPKATPHQVIESYDLKVLPDNCKVTEQVDAEDNIVHFLWFDGMNTAFNIKSEAIIETKEYNPLNFILYPSEAFKLPFDYSKENLKVLEANLETFSIQDSLMDFGKLILKEANSDTIPFLNQLTRQIHTDFTVIYREEGIPWSPDLTFNEKKGSCRDLTWMQIHLLRNMGLAARFVSGYFYIVSDNPQFELHAWVEVYLPGAGWIGFDPSNGLVAAYMHIPIASSTQHENTMPVTGFIRGDATSQMTTNLIIEVL